MEYLIKTNSIGGMTEEQFFQFCQENGSIHFEMDALGNIVVMEPTGSYTDWFNTDIITDLNIWNRHTKAGYVFGNNAGFTLPNKAVRAPDGAFIVRSRYEALPESDRKRFSHICPDFVIELLSESDNEKMREWMENGCRLAWMIDPHKRQTTIYRHNGATEIKKFDEVLKGEHVLPGFTLNLSKFSY
jgi:Uma2 family endonuclease